MQNDLQGAYEICRGQSFDADGPEIAELYMEHVPPAEKCESCGADLEWTLNTDWSGHGGGWTTQPCLGCARVFARYQLECGILDHMAGRGIPRRFALADLADFPDTIRKAAESDRSLYITGPAGTGKTHLLAAVMRHAILTADPAVLIRDDHHHAPPLKKYTVPSADRFPLFISIPRILQQIRASFNGGGGSEETILSRCAEAPVLLLDDLGAEKASDWVRQTVYLIIDDRYTSMRRTMITSNLSLDGIAQVLDDRIASRIAGMCQVLRMTGKDRRHSEPKGSDHPAAGIDMPDTDREW
ncbi:MAG: ATP-binding protein [Desulfobacterales bacterium]